MDKIHFKSFNSSRQAKTVGNYKVRNEVKMRTQRGKKSLRATFALRMFANPEHRYFVSIM